MALKVICISLVLVRPILGHMACETCIPLQDLLAPGYGISVSTKGLSSAAAYHNGTLTTLASIDGSEEYRNLMSAILEKHDTYEPRSTVMTCPVEFWDTGPRNSNKGILKLMRTYADSAREMIQDAFNPSQPADPVSSLDPTERMIQSQLLALEPFVSMSSEARSKVTVAMQIPPWLVASPHACNFLKAIRATFGRVGGLESTSSSTYTALGHELCRVSQEAYECDGPGRLATFEYGGHLAVASIIKTPLDIFDRMWTRYSTLNSDKPAELLKWINSFLNATSPDMIALAGPDVGLDTFQQALELSNAAGTFQPTGAIKVEDIIVQGVAQVAKDYLENHETDCSEFDECEDIRGEADRIAGEYKFHRPKVWPAVNNRHWRVIYDRGYTRFEKAGENAGQYIYGELL